MSHYRIVALCILTFNHDGPSGIVQKTVTEQIHAKSVLAIVGLSNLSEKNHSVVIMIYIVHTKSPT
jgi:hypothetical protein